MAEPTYDQIYTATAIVGSLSRHEPPVVRFKGEPQDDGDFRLEVEHDDGRMPWTNVKIIDPFGKVVDQHVS